MWMEQLSEAWSTECCDGQTDAVKEIWAFIQNSILDIGSSSRGQELGEILWVWIRAVNKSFYQEYPSCWFPKMKHCLNRELLSITALALMKDFYPFDICRRGNKTGGTHWRFLYLKSFLVLYRLTRSGAWLDWLFRSRDALSKDIKITDSCSSSDHNTKDFKVLRQWGSTIAGYRPLISVELTWRVAGSYPTGSSYKG